MRTAQDSFAGGFARDRQANADQLKSLSSEIRTEIDAHNEAIGSSLNKAVSAGRALRRAKGLLPHGQFQGWIEAQNFGAEYNWCAVCMRAAEATDALLQNYSWEYICERTRTVKELAALRKRTEQPDPWAKTERKPRSARKAAQSTDAGGSEPDAMAQRERALDERERALSERERTLNETELQRREKAVAEREQAVADHSKLANERSSFYKRMTLEESRLIRSCLHPDRHVDTDKLTKAFQVFARLMEGVELRGRTTSQ